MSSKFQGFNGTTVRISNPVKRRQMNRRRGVVAFGRRKPVTANAVNRKVKKVMNMIETKSVISEFSNSSTGALPGPTNLCLLNAIAEGSDSNQRQGDKINATSLWFQCIFRNDVEILIPYTCRLIIFWDKQPNGALPVIIGNGPGTQSLLDDSTAGGAGLTAIHYPPNQHSKQRYKILYDNTAVLQPTAYLEGEGITTVLPGMSVHRGFIKLNRLCSYTSGPQALAGISTNALYALFLVDEDSPASGAFKFNYKDA